MFYIDVRGRIKHKRQIEQYADNILSFLMPRKKANVDVEILVVKKIDDYLLGSCIGDKSYIEIELAKTDVNGEISLNDMMLTLAHELVHAKQLIRGELHPTRREWKKQDCTNQSYFKRPWEKQAYIMEDDLYNKFWHNHF